MDIELVEATRLVPVLVLKAAKYPLAHGILGVVRSLGRLGIDVYASCEDRVVPYAFSRFLRGRFRAPVCDRETLVSTLLDELVRMAGVLRAKSVLLPTDDESAIVIAENAAVLREHYSIPQIDPSLPRLLASKRRLYELGKKHDIAMPATTFAQTVAEVLAFADTARYPLVLKNSEPWIRLTAPAVGATTIIASRCELLALAGKWNRDPNIVLQEYIPRECSEDWIFHAYFDGASRPLVTFTGFKQQSWPPYAGVTAAAIAWPNEALTAVATAFCRSIRYRGIVDMDWRFDRRDGKYKLVDFNPRIGANFRLFVTEIGLDVVRSLYFDLTGRPVPVSAQAYGRRFVVENLSLASRLFNGPVQSAGVTSTETKTELAWYAADDRLPFIAMAVRFCCQVGLRLWRLSIARLGTPLRHGLRLAKPALGATRDRTADGPAGEFSAADKSHQGSKSWSRSETGEVEPPYR
jgi:D-aspartate ligase